MVEYDEADPCWNIMLTHDKNISMLQNLRAPIARQVYRHFRPFEHPVTYINIPDSGKTDYERHSLYSRYTNYVDVAVFGPEGAEIDPWRGVAPMIVDLIDERNAEIAFNDRLLRGKAMAEGLGVIPQIAAVAASRPCVYCGAREPVSFLIYKHAHDLEDAAMHGHFDGEYMNEWCANCAPHVGDTTWPKEKPKPVVAPPPPPPPFERKKKSSWWSW